jgi:hypothetical protein
MLVWEVVLVCDWLYWVGDAVPNSFGPLRDVSFWFAVKVDSSVWIWKFSHCASCGLHMHQPLLPISAVLGQEPVECETAKM